MRHLSSTHAGARDHRRFAPPARPERSLNAPLREARETAAPVSAPKRDATAGAVFSPCRRWRYSLWRRWGSGRRVAIFVRLNPSVADEQHLDPTLRRCRAFARREGCDGMVIINLFGLVSTDPRGLREAADPVGPETDTHIRQVLAGQHPLAYLDVAPLVVCAWGAHPAARRRAEAVTRLIAEAGHAAWCLGRTKDGAPRHPVRLAAATPLEGWE